MLKSGLVIVLTFVALACVDRYEKECDLSSFFECHDSAGLDSAGVVRSIAGTWTWDYSLLCAGITSKNGPRNILTYQGLVIEFAVDGSGLYKQRSTSTPFTWSIERINKSSYFRIQDASKGSFYAPHDALYGGIYVCGDQLLLSAASTDGFDNFFRK